MKVDIWMDYACPFCYIGEAHFRKALEEFEDKGKVEIVYHSYQLRPNEVPVEGQTMVANMVKNMGMSEEQVSNSLSQIAEMSKNIGIPMNAEKTIPANTYNAHRLSHFAKEKGLGKEMISNLYAAYFVDGLDIGNTEVLTKRAKEVGLDSKEALEVIEDAARYEVEMTEDRKDSSLLGVTSVPFFLFDERYSITGAKPVESFIGVLKGIGLK